MKHDYEVDGVVFHPDNDKFVFTLMEGGLLFGWNRSEENIFMGPVKVSQGTQLYIDDKGTMLTVPASNGRVYRIPIQIPEDGADYSAWLPKLATATVGFRYNDSGERDMLSTKQIGRLKEEVKLSVKNYSVEDWVDWLTDGSSSSKAAPTGDTSQEQIINDLARAGTRPDLIKALQLRPSDPKLLSALALRMISMSGVDEKNKRPVVFWASKARELGADNAVVFYRSAQIEKMLNNQTDALKYIDRAIELDSANTEYSAFKESLLQNN